MPKFKNSEISTVLLLIILGLLIWYLTSPCNTKENFSDNIDQLTTQNQIITSKYSNWSNMPLFSNVTVDTPTNVTVDTPTNVTVDTPPNQLPVLISANQPVTQPACQPVGQPVVQPVFQPLVQPTTQPVDKQVTQGFNNYDDAGGADINDAFLLQVPASNTIISAVDINKKNVQNYNAKDFLPKEINDQWFDTDFSQAKTNIQDDKLINTERYVIGINTVGQSLKNASYDIRGTIANPKFSVSPWNNSTYEPDYNIKPLC
jgi:hypothetical protein